MKNPRRRDWGRVHTPAQREANRQHNQARADRERAMVVDAALLVGLYQTGRTVASIAHQIGIPYNVARRVLREQGMYV